MKKTLYLVFLFCVAFASTSYAQFVGPFAPENWTIDMNDGFVEPLENQVVLTSGNLGNEENTDFTIPVQSLGVISFDWQYATIDGPLYDPAFFLLNGIATPLTDANGEDNQNGHVSVVVDNGDVFGFRIRTTDGIAGEGILTISNFTVSPFTPSTCASPVTISEGTQNLLSNEAGEQWFSFVTPNESRTMLIESITPLLIATDVYSGVCGDLTLLGAGNGVLQLQNIPPNETILIRMTNSSEGTLPWSFSLAVSGETCNAAVGASIGENATPAAPFWFSYTMPADGSLTVSSVGLATNDTYLRVFDGCDGVQLAVSDDFSGLQSQVTLNDLSAGQVLYINWDNVYSSDGFTWSVSPANLEQSINFNSLAVANDETEPFELNAAATSGLQVTYLSSDESVATVSGSTVTIIGVGTTTITASQSGNEMYLAAADVDQVLTVKTSQTIDFQSLPAKLANDEPFTISATASSGLDVVFGSTDPLVATVSGNTVTIVGAGTTVITATQAGNDVFDQVIAEQMLVVEKVAQEITFESLETKTVLDDDFELVASSSSGLAVTFVSSDPAVASVSGSTVTIHSAGTTTITATQAGNEIFGEATAEQQLTVEKIAQGIVFAALETKTVLDDDFELSASSSSGLALSFLSSNPSVASIEGSVVSIHSAGTTTITAIQNGNDVYAAASVERSLVVQKATQSISFESVTSKQFGDGSFSLSASATSGLSVTFSSSDPSVATVSGNIVTIIAAGTTSLKANQPGDNSYQSADEVSRELVVTKADQLITFTPISTKTFGASSFQLNAVSSAGLPVVFDTPDHSKITITGNFVSMLAPGAVTIVASQSGDPNHNAAEDVEVTFCINPPKPVITGDFLIPDTPVLSTGDSYNHQWFRNNQIINGANAPVLTISGTGLYTVQTSEGSCVSEVSNPFEVIITDVNEHSSNRISVAPNPARAILQVNGIVPQAEVSIMSMSGHVITVPNVWNQSANTREVTVTDLSPGLYLLLIKQSNKQHIVKFVKE